jgi:hypothetical protein
MKKKIKIFAVNSLIFFLFFLIIDVIYSNFLFSPRKLESIYERDNKIHHRVKANFKGVAKYGHKEPIVCTDKYGLKIKCNSNTNQNYKKNYDIGIIGDSIIFGEGLKYEETLVGILSQKTNLKVANLGSGSYSPLLYYIRLKELLADDFRFDHIIVFVDISDIHDETLYYTQNNELKHRFDKIKIYETEEIKKNKNISLKIKLKKFVHKNFIMTFSSISLIKREYFLFDPYDVFKKDVARYAWTFNNHLDDFSADQINDGIKKAKNNMNKIYELSNSNNIKFSIAVYPLPAQLLYDNVDNRQAKEWKNFCVNKCYNFYDFNNVLFKKKDGMNEKKFFKDYFITYDEHFNYNGNKILADEFIKIYKP